MLKPLKYNISKEGDVVKTTVLNRVLIICEKMNNNIAALLLPVWLLIAKEIFPYCLKKYASKKDDGTYNQEVLTDINKELTVALLRFPCDLIVIADGYIVARIFTCTEAITHIRCIQRDVIVNLTMQLSTNHALFWATCLLILPLCVLCTRKCEYLLYPKKGKKAYKVGAILLNILLYMLTASFVLWLLFTN